MVTLEGPDGASHEDVIAQAQKLYSPSALPGTEAFGGQAPGVPAAPVPMPLQHSKFGDGPVMGAPIMPSPMAAAGAVGGLLSKLDQKTGMGQQGILGAPIMPAPARINSIQNADVTRPAPTGLLGKISIPSKARAEENFATVKAAANDVPIDPREAYGIAQRAMELGSHGGTPPKVVTDFVKQADPQLPPMTYGDARDFASNASRLSATEKMSVNGEMGHQVKALAKALGTANEAAAEQAGVGDEYRAAMSEYRSAMKLKEFGKKAGQIAVGTGISGLLGGAAYKGYKTVKGLLEP